MNNLLKRMLGAARLNADTYEQVEADRTSLTGAVFTAVIASIAAAIGTGARDVVGVASHFCFVDDLDCLGSAYICHWNTALAGTVDARGYRRSAADHWFFSIARYSSCVRRHTLYCIAGIYRYYVLDVARVRRRNPAGTGFQESVTCVRGVLSRIADLRCSFLPFCPRGTLIGIASGVARELSRSSRATRFS
jgi:hypothetical protein